MGKSAVLKELQSRGYRAYGTDEHGIARWESRKTGQVMDPPADYDLHAWYKDHEWTINPAEIAKLADQSEGSGTPIFLCGVAAGTELVSHLFNTVIVLVTDSETLRRRILARTDNNFGKTEAEMKIVLEWQQKHVENYRKTGVRIIDATPSVQDVVSRVLGSSATSLPGAHLFQPEMRAKRGRS